MSDGSSGDGGEKQNESEENEKNEREEMKIHEHEGEKKSGKSLSREPHLSAKERKGKGETMACGGIKWWSDYRSSSPNKTPITTCSSGRLW